jgi:Ca2+-binding EF-hand superfamily protein
MDESYPFSSAFGLANNRENCVQAAEALYKSFLRANAESDKLHFETLVESLRNPITKEINEKQIKDLVKLFRPERDGTLDLIGFVRSVDQVYKDLRLLRASIRNSSQIDSAFEA